MKILDRYILSSYIKTFVVVLVILMFIFLLQTIWLYISELAGKDLDLLIIGKFLLYFSPKLIPLVLPLSILVTSIMTFGNFAENYEFAAMKSSGISLQRAMRGLTVFILLISIGAFFFANNVIPLAEYKSINLRRNIAKLKPTMAITTGIFNEVGEYNIKVKEKTGENDQYLKDVIIHQKSAIGKNTTVIKADRGELAGSEDSDVLSLILNDGNYYNELYTKDPQKRKRKPFAKSYFEEYVINIDVSTFNDVDMEEETKDNSYKMLQIGELKKEIDSQSVAINKDQRNFKENIYERTGIKNFDKRYNPVDTISLDTLSKGIFSILNDKDQLQIVNLALGNTNSALSTIKTTQSSLELKEARINRYELVLHEKYVLAVACFILFFVGAPLGAIIRKGGLGLPLVVAILLFLTYHFIGIFAKNSAKDGSLDAFIASWISTAIMLPLGIYLTYRATTDQGLLSFDFFTSRFQKLIKRKKKED